MLNLHAICGVPMHIECFGAIRNGRQEYGFKANEQHDR